MSVQAANDPKTLNHAVHLLQEGGLVIVPTETVYGMAVLADHGPAISRIYAIKGRSMDKALLAHIDGAAMAAHLGQLSELAHALIAQFWPGPLTLIVPKHDNAAVHPLASGGLASIALRCPDHAFTTQLIRQLGQSILAPSANLAGAAPPVQVSDISNHITQHVDMVVDGGRCVGGQASTLLDLCSSPPKILRQGGISRKTLKEVCGELG